MKEYCDECGSRLCAASAYGKPYVTCGPCGNNVCDRQCLADHQRHCDAVQEKREHPKKPSSLTDLIDSGVIKRIDLAGTARGQ